MDTKNEHQQHELLTVPEAAERLRVKPSTIRAWILRGEYLQVVHLGRAVRVTSASVDELIRENTSQPKKKNRKI